MRENNTFTVQTEQAGKRIDAVLSKELDYSRSAVQGWLEQGLVVVDGALVPKNYKLREGETVVVNIPAPVAYEAKAEDIPLDIIYEDADLLVVNKPKGMVVHPAAGHFEACLILK